MVVEGTAAAVIFLINFVVVDDVEDVAMAIDEAVSGCKLWLPEEPLIST